MQAHTVLEMKYTEQQLTAAVVSGKLRPVLAGPRSGASTSILSLIQRCWDENPENRPSFTDIVLELGPILEHRKKSIEENLALGESSILQDDQLIDGVNNSRILHESVNWSTQGELSSKKASLVVNSGLRNWVDYLYDPLAYHPVLSWGSFATCGRRETMEDIHFLMPQICNEKDIHFFAIFDGHRGIRIILVHHVSQFIFLLSNGINVAGSNAGAAAAEFSAQALPGFLQSLACTSRNFQGKLNLCGYGDDCFALNNMNIIRFDCGIGI
ncbi:hypothetical protein JCGZ_11549 [Jatropha curcas]|uniref:PPM-type phosphatase domain-containing protein n=1 Tax=Jatropha curcas TaxID=180498 RepID=A0A067K831_JATCU|nr:hypothetical protein JCGZ_11549 [Jatropha curcas]